MFRTIQKLLFAVGLLAASTTYALACPFCSAVSQTLTEQIEGADVAVLGELIDLPTKFEDGPEQPLFDEAIEASKATFRIDTVFRGEDELGETKEFRALYLSEKEPGEKFLILGRKQPEIEWGAPIWLSSRAQEYLKNVLALPASKDKAHVRLAFFEDYLQDEESLLRADSFDEFARADYDVLKNMKDRINRTRLLEWIADPEVTRSRRRLYFTMLGVCGTAEDVKLLEEMLRSEKETDWQALDALVACYLTLAGEAGMPLIEEQFLKKPDLEYVPLFAVTMALRFHGEQADIVRRERIIEAMRYVLDRKDLADLVITDLARWQDWESMDRLAQLFHDVDEDTFFIRMAVVKYMRVCPLPGAKVHLAEFAKVDPKVVKRATMTWPGLTPVKPKSAEPKPAEADKKRAGADQAAQGDVDQAGNAKDTATSAADDSDGALADKVKAVLSELQDDALLSDDEELTAASEDVLASPTRVSEEEGVVTIEFAKQDKRIASTDAASDSSTQQVMTEDATDQATLTTGSDEGAATEMNEDAASVAKTAAVTATGDEVPEAVGGMSTTQLRMTILAVAVGCAALLLFAFRLILRGRIEPIA